MDKRDYELLLALDQHKNITKAAQSLYMTQPAITKRIQKMEEELHCPLLIRSKRGVLLTPAAESLLPCARTILKNMEQMEELAAASQDYICGTLRLGCSLNYAHYRLPAILKDYTDRYPKVEVHITTEQSRQLYKMLCKEEISLAILRGEYNNNDMEKFSQVKIAQIGQFAENVFFGKPCGLMDQTACAVGGVITIDFKDPAHPIVGQTSIDLAKHKLAMCITDTKGSHADLTDDYAAIRREMESVAEQMGKKVLREVDEDAFYAAIPQLRKAVGDRAVVRAIHFYNDCRRAAQLCDAVREDDFDAFLRLIIEGGHSSFEFNQNAYSIKNYKEQGVPIALALSQKVLNGRGAWRLQGGGFAGTIQAFVPYDLLDTYKATIDACFGEGSCHVLNIRNYGAVPVTVDM